MTQHHPESGAFSEARIAECQLCLDNAEAYALHALAADERMTMDQHLQWCGACRRAITEVRRVTNVLPFLAVPAVPSASAKAGLFARIAEDDVAETAAAPAAIVSANPREAGPGMLRTPAKNPSSGASPWQRWIAPAIIAPLAICLVLLAGWTNSLRNEVDTLQARQQSPVTIAQVGSTGFRYATLCPETAMSGVQEFPGIRPVRWKP